MLLDMYKEITVNLRKIKMRKRKTIYRYKLCFITDTVTGLNFRDAFQVVNNRIRLLLSIYRGLFFLTVHFILNELTLKVYRPIIRFLVTFRGFSDKLHKDLH